MTREPTAVVLLYHRIADVDLDPFSLCVPPTEFRRQMTWIKNECHPVSLDTLVDGILRGSPMDRAVAITFDDGYLDNLTEASPILLELGLPATFFVTTERFTHAREYWWDALIRTECSQDELKELQRRVMNSPAGDRDLILAERLGTAEPCPRSDVRPMTAREVAELASRPQHAVGAHTVNHLLLPIQTPSVCQFEMVNCKNELESLLSVAVRAVAYPFGGFSTEVCRLASEAGFTTGLGTVSEPVRAGSDVMALPRWHVAPGPEGFPRRVNRILKLGT